MGRQSVHSRIPGNPVACPRVSRRRNITGFVKRASRNINHIGRCGHCIRQWRPALTTKGAYHAWTGFERLGCAVHPTKSVAAYAKPRNSGRCRDPPAGDTMAKRRVERHGMNLIPDGTAVASSCQHGIPRPSRGGADSMHAKASPGKAETSRASLVKALLVLTPHPTSLRSSANTGGNSPVYLGPCETSEAILRVDTRISAGRVLNPRSSQEPSPEPG
ncbi:hypothetical protein P3T43_000540 [Paraburkholderia sp. GAS41]|jgi:hypothetical protein